MRVPILAMRSTPYVYTAINQNEISWKPVAGLAHIIVSPAPPPESGPVRDQKLILGPTNLLSLGRSSTYCESITATRPQPPLFDECSPRSCLRTLFIGSLPDDTANNAALSALQSSVHDGTARWSVCAGKRILQRKTLQRR